MLFRSEISWMKNITNPNKVISPDQEVEVMILDINPQSHRISLGIKQCKKNPWQDFSEKHKVGDIVKGLVKDFTDFGVFVEFDGGIEGLIHKTDIANNAEEIRESDFKKNSKIEVVILGINYEKERISLGIKQLSNSEFKNDISKVKEDSILTCVVTNIKKDFLEIELDSGLKGIIKRLDLSKNKTEQKTDKYEVGDRIEAKVVTFNKTTGKLLLSIKAIEVDSRDSHIYSPSDSGASIGSIAGDVLSSLSFDQDDSDESEDVKKDSNKNKD